MAAKGRTVLKTATQQTTDATNTQVAATTLDDAASMLAIAKVCARRSSNGDSASYYIRQGVKRHAAGAATLVGTLVKDAFEDAGAAGWDVVFTVSSNDIRVQVTGQVSATIDWLVELEIFEYQP